VKVPRAPFFLLKYSYKKNQNKPPSKKKKTPKPEEEEGMPQH
jgi:hypothetical protein